MKKIVYLLVVVLLLIGKTSLAQQEVFKVSKPLQYHYSHEIQKIELLAEKAAISIIGWDKNYIEIQVIQVSRNSNKKTAESDLKYVKVAVRQVDNKLFLKNYFEGKNTTVGSNLSVEYHLRVPKSIEFKIKNLFGRIEASKLSSPLGIDVSYGSVELTAINGNVVLTSRYSTIVADQLSGKFVCNAEKSDLTLKSVQAQLDIKSKYGEIALDLVSNQYNVNVNSQRSKITVSIPNKAFNYKLKTLHSEIILPGSIRLKTDFYENISHKDVVIINLSTSYCPIVINQQP